MLTFSVISYWIFTEWLSLKPNEGGDGEVNHFYFKFKVSARRNEKTLDKNMNSPYIKIRYQVKYSVSYIVRDYV